MAIVLGAPRDNCIVREYLHFVKKPNNGGASNKDAGMGKQRKQAGRRADRGRDRQAEAGTGMQRQAEAGRSRQRQAKASKGIKKSKTGARQK